MRVALTGGIASGKSVAAAELARLGVAVIDYDQLAHDAIAPGTPGAAAVVRAFGPPVMASPGIVDRAALAAAAFASDDARRRLEAIVHPLVYEAAGRAEAAALRDGHAVVVHEIPLLVEAMDPAGFDLVIVVDAPAGVRTRRLVAGRGMTPERAAKMLAAQAGDERRRAAADVVWDGSGTPAHLRAQAGAWVASLTA